MLRIEKQLHEHFASAEENDINHGSNGNAELSVLPDSGTDVQEEPFAKVNSVAPESPAEDAGLKPGDEIRSFGYVNRLNHDGLKKVAECVQGNEGVCIDPSTTVTTPTSNSNSSVTFLSKCLGQRA